MSTPRWWAAALLALLAVGSGTWLYRLQRADAPPELVGPPRSDYTLEQFDLVALDAAGTPSFAVNGPRLARHHHLGTLNVESPSMRFPDSKGAIWTARADRGFVDSDGALVRLQGDVQVRGPADEGAQPVLLVGSILNLYPRVKRIASESAVTITGPGSILRGRALEADLDARRFDLADVTGRYDTQR